MSFFGTYPVRSATLRAWRGSAVTSSSTSGWRVTSTHPAIPAEDGKRIPTRFSWPSPETASSTSSPASSSSRKIEDARASKIARATSTIDCSSALCDSSDASDPAAAAARSVSASVMVCLPCSRQPGGAGFSAEKVSSGCAASTSAQMPAMCGAAKLFPLARIVPPPGHAMSTSMPCAKNSTGGFGFAYQSRGRLRRASRRRRPRRTATGSSRPACCVRKQRGSSRRSTPCRQARAGPPRAAASSSRS